MNNMYNNEVYKSKKSEMDSTTGRFFKTVGLIVVIIIFLSPVYLVNYFMESEDFFNTEIDEDIEYEDLSENNFDYTVDAGNLLLYEYDGSSFNGKPIYSISETNMAKLVDYHEIACLSGECSFENFEENILYFGNRFCLFRDGKQMGVYDVGSKKIVGRFDESLNYEDYKFILDEDRNINMKYFFVKLDDNKYGVYDVELQDFGMEYDIDNFVYTPFLIPSESSLEIETIYKDTILVRIDGKYRIFNYVTGEDLLHERYDSVNCVKDDDNYYCELKNGQHMSMLLISLDKKYYELVHETYNFYYKYNDIIFEKNLGYLSIYSLENKEEINTSYKIDSSFTFVSGVIKNVSGNNYLYLNFTNSNLIDGNCNVYKYNSSSEKIEFSENVACVK